MELQYTLERSALQLKNKPRTLINVAGVVQEIMKTVYDAHFQMLKIADRVGILIAQIVIFSASHGYLNTLVLRANTLDMPV